jgi:hypothetical protein
MKNRWLSLLLLFAFVVAACRPVTELPTVVPTSPTNASIPPSPTTEPTAIPSRPMGLPEHIDFPVWMKDRQTTVLFVPTGVHGERIQNLGFVAAGSWERFDLPVEDVGGYFWLPDGSGFGLLGLKNEALAIIDIASGNVSFHPAPGRIFSNSWELAAFGDYSDPARFILAEPGRISADGKFVVTEYFLSENGKTAISNNDTGEVFYLPPTNDIYRDEFEGSWSPVAPRFAVVSMKNCEDTAFPECGEYTLQVYDAPAAKLVGAYKNIANFSWSPNGLQILHTQEPNFWGEGPGINPPCIFDLTNGGVECFDEIRFRHPISTMTYAYAWSPDMRQIGYAYDSVIDNGSSFVGGFCLITIATHIIDCPVETFAAPDYQSEPIYVAHFFRWSPDGKFVVFQLKARLYGSDDGGGPPLLAILDIAAGKYIIIGEHIGDWQEVGLWRPLP